METSAIIMSIFGPLVGVFAAWKLSRRDARAESCHRLFAKIFEDMQNYRHNFMRFYFIKKRVTEVDKLTLSQPYDPEMDLREKETDLNTDCLMLGLLFNKKADKAGVAIQNLITSSEVFNRQPLPDLDSCNENLAKLVKAISTELRELHKLVSGG